MSGWNSVGWNRGREGGRGEYVGTSYVPYNYRKEQVERFRYGDNESVNYVETHGHGNGHGQVLGEGQGLSSTGQLTAARSTSQGQQQQIEDLERKVNLVLLHNEQLIIQNNDLAHQNATLRAQNTNLLRQSILNKQPKQFTGRFQQQDTQYLLRKFKQQSNESHKQYNILLDELQLIKISHKEQHLSLKNIIVDLQQTNDNYKKEIQKLKEQIERRQVQLQNCITNEVRRIQLVHMKQLQQRQSQNRIKCQQYQTSIKQIKEQYERQQQQQKQQHQIDKQQIHKRKNMLIDRLQSNHDKQMMELRKQFEVHFGQEMKKLEEEAGQKCKNQREKVEEYMRSCLEGAERENTELEREMMKEIESLQKALECRKKMLEQVVGRVLDDKNRGKGGNENEYSSDGYYEELIAFKARTKQLIAHYQQQIQAIKTRASQKHNLQLGELIKTYETKIDILTTTLTNYQNQTKTLTNLFENQLTSKYQQKKHFQIQISKLKILVRKLRVQVQTVQQQFRLHVDGVREQSNTFSMSMMKSVLQQKQKAGFFQDQNRKLRRLYDEGQKEIDQMRGQNQDKIRYYEGKLVAMRRMVQEEKQGLRKKQQEMEERLNKKEGALREGMVKERIQLRKIIDGLSDTKVSLQKKCVQWQQRYSQLQTKLKDKIDSLSRSENKQNEQAQHIQRLRLELQMAGVTQLQRDGSLQQWKVHYERIIEELKEERIGLNQKNEVLVGQLAMVVKRYGQLEKGLERTTVKWRKKEGLEEKIVALGGDGNLVKNMAELFGKHVLEGAME